MQANFVDRHEEVTETEDSGMGHFEIFSGMFQPGNVCTGANGCTVDINNNGGCSHYVILVGPQEW